MECNVLFGHKTGADAGAEVVVEEFGGFNGGDVAAAFEEASGEDRDSVGVGFYYVDEHFGEGYFFGEGVGVRWREGLDGAEGLLVVVVDAGYVRVGNDYEGEVAEGYYASAEADGEEFSREAGGSEESLGGEWWTSEAEDCQFCKRNL